MSNFETIVEGGSQLTCPIEDAEGNVYIVSQSGELYTVVDGQLQLWFHTGGQPSGLVFDANGNAFVCDLAHQAILSQTENDSRLEVTPVVKAYEGKSLLGPNSLVLSNSSNRLYFTDSGPLGETTIENANGSVFMIDLNISLLKHLALGCLSHPSGLALSLDEQILYVAETYKNRIVRFAQHPEGVYHMSTFYQFNGRLGPTALAVSSQGILYVARYDFAKCAKDGLISVITQEGEHINDIPVNGLPEITGLFFCKTNPSELMVTENSTNSCVKITVPHEEI